MSNRGVLPFGRCAVSLSVSRGQLLQKSGITRSRDLSPWLICAIDGLLKLSGLSVRYILQRQWHSAAAAVPSWVLLPSSKDRCAYALLGWILLSLGRNVQSAAVSYGLLLSEQWPCFCCALSAWSLLVASRPVITRHLRQMSTRYRSCSSMLAILVSVRCLKLEQGISARRTPPLPPSLSHAPSGPFTTAKLRSTRRAASSVPIQKTARKLESVHLIACLMHGGPRHFSAMT